MRLWHESIPPSYSSFPTPIGNPSRGVGLGSRRGDRRVSLPRPAGPLTLTPVEDLPLRRQGGRAGGGPRLANPSHPSITTPPPSPLSFRCPARNLGLAHSHLSLLPTLPSPVGAPLVGTLDATHPPSPTPQPPSLHPLHGLNVYVLNLCLWPRPRMSGHQTRKGKGTRSPMSRTGLHKPRLSRTASPPPGPRHAPLFRLLVTLHPAPQHPQQALPKGPTPWPSQRSITAPPPILPGPSDRQRKVPKLKSACSTSWPTP